LPGLEAAREVNVEHVDDQPLTGREIRLAEPPEKKTFDFTQRRLLSVLAVVLAKTGVGVICGNRGILPSSANASAGHIRDRDCQDRTP
jgi:hypothetical protein